MHCLLQLKWAKNVLQLIAQVFLFICLVLLNHKGPEPWDLRILGDFLKQLTVLIKIVG